MDIITLIVILIVSLVLTIALAPKPPTPAPAALSDFQIPTAEEGREIPVLFGETIITGPNVVYFGNLRSTPITKKGGK